MRQVTFGLAILALGIAGPFEAGAQNLPDGWSLRLDRARGNPADIGFTTMDPGWHITTGPAGIIYNNSTTASGEYSVEAEFYLFDTQGRNREAYGIFIGGSDLQGPDQAYTYFLIRNDGSFLVKQRTGTETTTLTPWTRHDTITIWDGSEDTANNVLGVRVLATEIAFDINGQEVARVPREGHPTDGVVGFRVNHALNLHVARLELSS